MTTIENADAPSAQTIVADLQTWLTTHTQGGTVQLTDDVLGGPMLQGLFHTSVLTVRDAQIDATQPASVGLTGTVDLLGATGVGLDLRLRDDGDAVAARVGLTSAAGHPVTLSGILASVAGASVTLPPEVPDLGFTDLSFAVTPSTGAFTLDGACVTMWSLPFGGAGLLVAGAGLHVERTVADVVQVGVRLTLDSAGTLPVADGFQVTGFSLTFAHTGAEWELGGTLYADVLDQPYSLTASIDLSPTRREFAFRAEAADPTPVDLAGAGSLTFHSLSARVIRTREADPAPSAAASTGRPQPDAVRLDPLAVYSWTVDAAGQLDLLDTVVLAGTLTVAGEPGSLGLTLRPGTDGRGAEVTVPLPGASSVVTHLGLDSLDVTRKVAGSTTTWVVAAEAVVWFSGLPGGLDTVLPGSRDSELTGTLAITTGREAGVSFSVTPVLPVQPFHLPSVHIEGFFDLDLSQARSAVEVGRLEVKWARGGGLEVTAELGVGLPAQLNEIFGPGHDVFVVYDPALPETLQQLSLAASATGGPSLTVRPLTSPLRALVLTPTAPGSDDRQATLDLGEWGSFTFVVPSVAVSGDTFRAKAAFTQHGLALPLSPLKWVLTALGLSGVNRFLPDRLPLTDIRLYDDVTGLNTAGVVDLVMDSLEAVTGLTPPDRGEVWSAVEQLSGAAARLPDRLKPYLDIHLPETLDFDLAISAEGAILGGLSVAGAGDAAPSRADQPLRMLLPGMSVAGPLLTGIELWNLQVGEILGGTALLVRADLNVDQFDLLPLAALLALPESTPGLPDPKSLTRRLVANRLTMVVVPEALVAAPVFFDDLAVEYRGIEGADLGAHLSFPEPELDFAQAMDFFRRVGAFFTETNATLTEESFTSLGLDLRLTAGPAYLQLPSYLGGETYGSRTATSEVSAAGSLVSLLNGLKKLYLDELLQALPQEILNGRSQLTLGPLSFGAAGEVSTPAGARRGLQIALVGQARLSSLVTLFAGVTVLSNGTTSFGIDYMASGRLTFKLPDLFGGQESPGPGIVLSGAVTNLARAGEGVLQLTDPAARVVMPGPTGVLDVFTVEWWMYPTALSDYNQFVSASDRWGSFVFHSTARGEVYCGTDVATRFTPAELPAGTVELDTWQHFAFTYAHGTARLFKNGVEIAVRTGMSAGLPWTGMRLGISQPGTEVAGRVSELRVWNYGRPVEYLRADMYTRHDGHESGLIACWPLDEDSGDQVLDRGPNGWNGTASTVRRLAAGPATVPPLALPAGPAQAVDIRGACELDLFGNRVFSGTATVYPASGVAIMRGNVDLFGPASPLKVRGALGGRIEAGEFDLHGEVTVNLAGWTLAQADLEISSEMVRLSGRWLDVFGVTLLLITATGVPWFRGSIRGTVGLDVQVAGKTVHCRCSVTLTADVEPTGITLSGSATVSVDNAQLTTGQLAFRALPTWKQLESALSAIAIKVITP